MIIVRTDNEEKIFSHDLIVYGKIKAVYFDINTGNIIIMGNEIETIDTI